LMLEYPNLDMANITESSIWSNKFL
jgi:hypothetical protein